MVSKPVTLGEYNFTTKKEAKKLYSKILNETDLEHDLEGGNYDYVMALLLNHPCADEKIGCGVEAIRVSTGYTALNRCFHVVRTDGTVDNFSISKCIDGEHSEFHKFCIACRRAVEADVRSYKRKYFEKNSDENGMVKCQSTCQLISFDEAHVDHREPFTFSALAYFFHKSLGMDLCSVQYATKGKYGNEFSDVTLIELFQKWHEENAKLRIVHGKENLSKSYLGRVKETKADGRL